MEKNRVKWASRRGMLELDIILGNFVEFDYDELALEDKQRYWNLLESEDQDLFNWFIHRQSPEESELRKIVDLIRERSHKRPASTRF